MKTLALAGLSAALLLSATAVLAQDQRIVIRDLDLSSIDGAATFDSRVNAAAHRACRTGAPLLDIRCRALFRAEAMRLLPQARRDDYARSRGGRVLAMVPVFYG